jgi:uncharacterized protein (DUF362 family)/Pyruvate/2-oxoacid:ferredoxin oxidoreductase delta subunit
MLEAGQRPVPGMGGGSKTKIAAIRCDDYREEHVAEAVRRCVDLFGGIRSLIRPRERVLIKPNLLKASFPDRAVTTHPEVVRAVIRLVHEAGAEALVGDGPGIGDLRRVAERSGILAVVRQEGAVLAEFDDAVTVKSNGRFQRFEISRVAAEADAIINLPKFKTHGMTILTGAVKNLFGCIPGKRKVQWHFNTGVDRGSFMRMLVELAALLKPRFTIMDSIVGMEGNGPGSGDPRTMGVLLAGRDPVAVDSVAGRLVGIPPETLPVIKAAAEAGTGETKTENIQIVGDRLSSLIVSGFRLPPREHPEWRIPEFFRKRLKEALTTRPVIDHSRCIRCGICQKDCPQQAIAERDHVLAIDYRICIRCFCCQEFCPQGAVSVGRGWMLKAFGK